MTGWKVWTALAILGFTGIVTLGLTLIPTWIYPSLTESDLRGVPSTEVRIQLQQAQAQLQNNLRSALLQMTAGVLVVVGAVATWWQVHVNREGQITDRFTRAIEHLGSDNVDMRIGAIYALERIAKNSPPDRNTVQFILGAFVRNHAPWHVGNPGGPEHPTATIESRPWLQIVAPDVQAAVGVLARRPTPPSTRKALPDQAKLYLSRVDLRGLQLYRGRLIHTQLRHTNLARSWLQETHFDRSDLKSADLRRCQLQNTSFTNANLNHAYLAGANLSGANLTRADLRGVDLTDAILDGTTLTGAQADNTTTWPPDFDTQRLTKPESGRRRRSTS